MLKGIISHHPPWRQLITLVLLALMGTSIFYSIGLLLANAWSGIDLIKSPEKLTAFQENPGMVNVYRFLLLFQHTGMFILPALFFPYLMGERFHEMMRFKGLGLKRLLFTIGVMLFFFPISNYLAQLNAGIELPEGLGWLEERFQAWEDQARGITEELLAVSSSQGLLVNLLLVAVLPAIGEEMIFRGSIQHLLERMGRNVHLAIWVGAILFSAMHLQFYGFLPRLMLGALFGYMLLWTGTLWVPILAHFINNAAAVVITFSFEKEELEQSMENAGGQEGQGLFVLICALAVGGLLSYAKWNLRGGEK